MKIKGEEVEADVKVKKKELGLLVGYTIKRWRWWKGAKIVMKLIFIMKENKK